jgi:hypothetical protein
MRVSVQKENLMSRIDFKAPVPFTPPVVDIADPSDGLLKTVDLSMPIPVKVEVWEAAIPGYYFQLMLNEQAVGDTRIITEADQVGDMITVYLNEDLLNQNGIYWLGFKATSPNTQVSDLSPVIPLKVDRSRPGAALLAPMIFPNACFTDRLTGLIPGYAGMEQGDVIQTLCNGTPGPAHTVQADELTLRPIEIDFERKVMQSLAAENVSFEYLVTDRAGNPSIMSLPVLLSIKL